MRRLAVIGAITVAMLVPGKALAGLGGEFHGRFEGDPFTQIAFDIDTINGKRKIRHIGIVAPFACYSGSTDRNTIFVEGALKIHRHGRFSGIRTGDAKGASGPVFLSGRVVNSHRVKGTMRARMNGTFDPSTHCYTGLLRWRASDAPLDGV
jgi:hypothetical protein